MSFNRRILPRLIKEIAAILLSLIIIVPLLIVVFGSFKDPEGAMRFNILPPTKWNFENYRYVYEFGFIARAFKNSFIVTAASVILTTFSAGLGAFYISRKRGRFSAYARQIFLVGLIIPLAVIPSVEQLQLFHMSGSYLGIIAIYCSINMSFSLFLYDSFITTVPREMDEAAIIDGCGSYSLFFKIILPLLLPVTITNVIITTTSVWNDFYMPLYFFNSSSKYTLPLSVYNFFGQYSRDWNYVFADLVITVLPVVILYLFLQRYIISGMTAGAVKG